MDKEKLEKEMAEKRAALEKEHADKLAALEARSRIELLLPDVGVPVNHVHFANKPEPWIDYQVRELADVLRIVDAFAPLVPHQSAKASGCRVLQPREMMKKEYAAAALSEEWAAPILRFHAYGNGGGQSASFEFWARCAGRLFKIAISSDFHRGGGSFGFHAHCRGRELFGKYVIEPGSWTPPQDLDPDDVVKWGTGSDDSAQWSIRWRTLEKFRAVIGGHVAKRAKWAQEARERARADYLARRNVRELEGKARFVLATLARPEVAALLPAPADGWTLENIRAAGYGLINKTVQKAAPEVLRVGIHDFANTLYFLSKDTDDYEHAPDYREDLRAVFAQVQRGDEVR